MRHLFLIVCFLTAGLPSFAQYLVPDTTYIFFALDADTISRKEKVKLDSVCVQLKRHTGFGISIAGYTDGLGSANYNKQLSQRRANRVKAYFIANGVGFEQISSCKGFGVRTAGDSTTGGEGVPADRVVHLYYMHEMQGDPMKSVPEPQLTANKISNPVIEKMKEIQVGGTLVLNNLLFYGGSHSLKPGSQTDLLHLLEYLQSNKKVKVEIQGHICCEIIKPDGYDFDSNDNHLSRNRAKAIYDYLISKGIETSRLSYKGYGHTQPLVDPEITENDRNKNRRVSIKVLEK